MAFLKNIFGKPKKVQEITDFKLVQMWWWRHNAHCGKIVIQPESFINNDNLLVVFENDAGEQWNQVLEIESDKLMTFEIDYATLLNANKQIFFGEVKMIVVKWKHFQQRFLAKSFFLVNPDDDF